MNGEYRFVTLSTPYQLAAGTYRIWSDYFAADSYPRGGSSGVDAGVSGVTFATDSYYGGNGAMPATADGTVYRPVSFAFSIPVAGPTWSGNGLPSPTYDWNDGANWAGIAPVDGDNVVFAGTNNTTTNNNIGALAVKDMLFNGDAGAFVNGGNAITLTGGITNSSTSLQTINHHIGLTGTGATQTIKTVAGDILINGNISDGDLSAHGIVKDGAQTLTLAGANNTYSGPTTVTAGTLIVTGKLASAVGVNNGGRLVGSSGTLNGLVTANSGGVVSGTGTFAGGVSVLSGGKVSPGTDTTVGTLATSTLSLASGSILNFNIASTGSLDQIAASASGGLTLNGGGFNLYQDGSSTSPFAAFGTYDLLGYSGTLGGSVSNLTVLNRIPGYKYSFGTLHAGYVTLKIEQGTHLERSRRRELEQCRQLERRGHRRRHARLRRPGHRRRHEP